MESILAAAAADDDDDDDDDGLFGCVLVGLEASAEQAAEARLRLGAVCGVDELTGTDDAGVDDAQDCGLAGLAHLSLGSEGGDVRGRLTVGRRDDGGGAEGSIME